jgi:ParB-like chromosome segregation protein Spo0J
MNKTWYTEKINEITKELDAENDLDFKIDIMNKLRLAIHEVSPLKTEPTDCVIWTKVENVIANSYNPNVVAPPEMELLRLSIGHDGYTQPVVVWKDSKSGVIEVVDGFHRSKVCREFEDVNKRVHGYLPIAIIKEDCTGINDRIAATVRHNRARGKHKVDGMSNIVMELKRRNWSDKRIGKELGMDPDEVLRLAQITGLAEMFKDREFSKAWEAVIEEDNPVEVIDG